MGFCIYREGVFQPGDNTGDWLHEAWWDGSMDKHLDICIYELMTYNKDEIREELPEWYEQLLPFASHPVNTNLTLATFNRKKILMWI